MKKNLLPIATVCLLFGFSITVCAQDFSIADYSNPESCTSIMVGKKASADGSTITSHTCDSNFRTWMDIVPSRTNLQDTTVNILIGRMHTETPKDVTGIKIAGTVPDVAKTYSFLNTSYPCLNEKQLAMGETTITGKKELVNPNALFNIEELQKLALERCTTAREAILLMDELTKKYGYRDWGECLTIADKKEVWHFEIFGVGKDKIGAVWAAVRIPDDHVGVSANIPRIGQIERKNPNMMASNNIESEALNFGHKKGEPLLFWSVFGGVSKPYDIRDFHVLNTLAPSLNLSRTAPELPISVKPDKKVSVNQVMELLRSTYSSEQYDMVKNLKVAVKDRKTNLVDTITSPMANPWMGTDMVTLLNSIKDSTVVRVRNIAVPQCAYSHVIQLRDWMPDAVGGVAWLSFDNPGQSPRIPMFAGINQTPASFMVCGQHNFRPDAAVWSYRRANKIATIKWGVAKPSMEKAVLDFEQKAALELPAIEANAIKLINEGKEAEARNILSQYTESFAGATAAKWQELEAKYWMIFCRGY